ncbi:MAG: 50S ribosomal protein L29 [Desulfurococcales archaeon]|nr:50S ribosomal protein L29 [Desulfurococcales archaeon]
MPKFKVRASDLRKMSPEERMKLLEEWRSELIKLRYQAAAGSLENPGKLREYRRNIARLLTIMREEELRSQGKEERA